MADGFDSPWKEAISRHFPRFLEFFFPEIYGDVDWSRGHEFLESELQAIARDSAHGRRHVDALVQVTRRSGQRQVLLVHIEVQSQVDGTFRKRMLLYHTRIADRFGRDLCSLAILGDGRINWRPAAYRSSVWGCRLELHFPVRKLLDYPSWASHTDNPFAWLTAAHLQAQATRKKSGQRAELKKRLIRGLYQCGLTHQAILELFRLVDWVLALPKQMEYAFRQDLAHFEEENKMVYVTSVERIAREEGRKEGFKEGRLQNNEAACQTLREAILSKLSQRWGDAPLQILEVLKPIQDLPKLIELNDLALTANSFEDWKQRLPKEPKKLRGGGRRPG